MWAAANIALTSADISDLVLLPLEPQRRLNNFISHLKADTEVEFGHLVFIWRLIEKPIKVKRMPEIHI